MLPDPNRPAIPISALTREQQALLFRWLDNPDCLTPDELQQAEQLLDDIKTPAERERGRKFREAARAFARSAAATKQALGAQFFEEVFNA